MVKFNIDKCKGCELCVVVCPKQILKIHDIEVNSLGYHPVSVTDMDQCIACASCAVMCPDGVISVYAAEQEDGNE